MPLSECILKLPNIYPDLSFCLMVPLVAMPQAKGKKTKAAAAPTAILRSGGFAALDH